MDEKTNNWRYGVARLCCTVLIGAVLLGVLALCLLTIVGDSALFRFSDITWSPDGTHLAFTTERAYGSDLKLYVVDANGENLRKLADLKHVFDSEDVSLSAPRWDPLSNKIYLKGTDNTSQADTMLYYLININEGNPQQISESEFLSGVKTDDSISTVPQTECDNVPHSWFRAVHSSRLVAQNSCYDAPTFLVDCFNKLLVCDSSTGKLVFKLDEVSMHGWSRNWIAYAALAILGISASLVLVSLFLFSLLFTQTVPDYSPN